MPSAARFINKEGRGDFRRAKDEYAKFGAKNFGEASRQAALDMIADINGALGK